MKITKTQQEFIKEATTNPEVCAAWRQDIKQTFPKLFKETELVVGKWYKTNHRHLVCVSKLNNLNLKSFGFGVWPDEWSDSLTWGDYTDDFTWTPSTDKEVEDALIKEAKKRGFKEGVNVGNSNGLVNEFIHSDSRYYHSDMNMFFMGGTCVFLKGKWATIIETITKAEAEKELGKTIICEA